MIQLSDKILKKLNTLPELPGIYKFLDSDNRVIYIGKSICLRKRVKSYDDRLIEKHISYN